jgi:TatD DNase family protein
MMGLHPTAVRKNYRKELEQIEYELEHRHYIGIGETGIDLYWDKTHLKEQCLAFSRQIELSLLYNLPIIIHARESFDEILEILEGYKGKNIRLFMHSTVILKQPGGHSHGLQAGYRRNDNYKN